MFSTIETCDPLYNVETFTFLTLLMLWTFWNFWHCWCCWYCGLDTVKTPIRLGLKLDGFWGKISNISSIVQCSHCVQEMLDAFLTEKFWKPRKSSNDLKYQIHHADATNVIFDKLFDFFSSFTTNYEVAALPLRPLVQKMCTTVTFPATLAPSK